MAIIKAVECDHDGCGELLKADGKEFFSLYGKLTLGMGLSIFDDNVDKDGKVTAPQFFCKVCFSEKIRKILDEG